MVNLNTNRIALTRVGNEGPDLAQIVDTLAHANGTSQVRAKSDGKGGTVIYGHKKTFFTFRNRSNPEREVEGTKLIFKAVENYVAGKSTQTQKLAQSLLSNFYDERFKTWNGTISSQEVIEIKRQLDEVENLAKYLQFADRFVSDQDLTTIFTQNMSLCSSILREGSTPERKKQLAQVPVPEMGAGMMIAVLNGLDGRERHRGIGDEVLQPFGTPGKVDFLEGLQSIANAFTGGEPLDDVLDQFCNLARDRFFSTESFEEWSETYNREHANDPEFKPVKTPNDIRAPIFLIDDDAIEAMEKFHEASGREKLEILKDVFEKHMYADQDYTISPLGLDSIECLAVLNRTGGATPNEAMAKGINWFSDAVFKPK